MFKRRKSIKLGKGVKLNLGKKGISSVSVGGKGLTMNFGSKGIKATASIRGTGLSTSAMISGNKSEQNTNNPSDEQQKNVGLLFGFGIFLLPYICSWFLLRSGYSASSRLISFSWMAFMMKCSLSCIDVFVCRCIISRKSMTCVVHNKTLKSIFISKSCECCFISG